jgi:hypothetical protein
MKSCNGGNVHVCRLMCMSCAVNQNQNQMPTAGNVLQQPVAARAQKNMLRQRLPKRSMHHLPNKEPYASQCLTRIENCAEQLAVRLALYTIYYQIYILFCGIVNVLRICIYTMYYVLYTIHQLGALYRYLMAYAAVTTSTFK